MNTNIRQLRKTRKLSQEELADAVGTTRQTITSIEGGKLKYQTLNWKKYFSKRAMNILFFLTPKAMCHYVYDDFTIRQALEKMEAVGFAALPILNRRGEYRGTITEGDLLWAMKNIRLK